MHSATDIRAFGYVPGRAAGRVHWGIHAEPGGDVVLVVVQGQLAQISGAPAALIVVEGAPFSHAMVGCLARRVPTVIVDQAQAAQLSEGHTITVDGRTGVIHAGWAPEERSGARPAAGPIDALQCADGARIELRASVRTRSAARHAVEVGAAAIGLLRSEFLLDDLPGVPDERHWLEALDALCAAADPLSVTVRLLDIAPDKQPPWLRGAVALRGAIGLQGARLFDIEPVRTVIEGQVSAIARLCTHRRLRVLIPYLTRYEELCRWAAHLRSRLPDGTPIGAMVETPAAALDVRQWLAIADFVSVGCNDLMQCLFAADRDEPATREFLDPYSPVLYRFLRQVAQACEQDLARVQLCGVLPHLPGVMPVLVGLGYRTFSVDAALIPHLSDVIRGLRTDEATDVAQRLCASATSEQARALMLRSATAAT